MSGRTRSCKRVEDDIPRFSRDLQDPFDKPSWLRSIKRDTAIEDRTDLLLRLIGMPSNLIRPKVRRKQTTHTIEICLTTNAAFATFGEVETRPLSALIDSLGICPCLFEWLDQH